MALASSSGRPMVKMSSRLPVPACSLVSRKIAMGAWVTMPITAIAPSIRSDGLGQLFGQADGEDVEQAAGPGVQLGLQEDRDGRLGDDADHGDRAQHQI